MNTLLLLLTAYLPFQLALNPTAGVDLASIRVLILLIFFLWLAQSLKKKRLVIKSTLLTGLIIIFLFLNILSVVVAVNTDWSLRKLMYLLSIFPLYFAIISIINKKEQAHRLIMAIVYSGVAVAGLGIVQFLLQFIIGLEQTYKLWADYVVVPFLGQSFGEAVLANPSWLVNIAGATYLRATATFPDPHMLSFYLGMVAPLALGLALIQKKKKIIWASSLAIILVADVLTFSRGGYLGLFAGGVMLAIIFWNKAGKKYKGGVLLAISIIMIAFFAPSPVSRRFSSSFNFKEGSNQGRIEIWRQAAGTIAEHPIIGVGLGNYALAVKPTATYREPIYAHNTYLDIAAETGITNALIWLSLLGVVGLNFLKQGRSDAMALMLAVSIVIFATHSLVETALYSPVVLALLLILISFSNIRTYAFGEKLLPGNFLGKDKPE
jgi:O-antigen ligase